MAVSAPLNHGLRVLVDIEDAALVHEHSWFANPWAGGWYAMRRDWTGGKSRAVLLHREIMQPPPGFSVDHINSNGLDNRRSNLRLATAQENARNRRIGSQNKSGFKGAHWDKRKCKWRAMICVDGRSEHIGYFADAASAHAAYVATANRLFGEFARAA